ncbi:IS200/IS605 family accessory protein TnpB-related protein [Scytonema sp. NUACC26]|uniref:IS200/IS605 family accessory protein TnpB-related protein n=1 Tax=Scytonema sp. NUACC26 TaxID=3140176 RepID=UPI0034DBA2D4
MSKKKKSLISELTTIRKSKVKSEKPIYQRRVGIEAKLPQIPRALLLEDMSYYYGSYRRSAVNLLQQGLPEEQVEKILQTQFGLAWAWADSITTLAKSTYDQLTTAKENRIEELKSDIKSGWKYIFEEVEKLEESIAKFSGRPQQGKRIEKKLLGLKSKALRLEKKQVELSKLEKSHRLKICFGGKKLFNAQHHLEANDYSSHEEWKENWDLARSGLIYSVGKGSIDGNNPVCQIHHVQDNEFTVTVKPFSFLQEDYGQKVIIPFLVNERQKYDLLYALQNSKPVTVQLFRREEKDNNWYIHLTTYVQVVTTQTSIKNGCLGIDLNAESIDVVYVKRDGNKGDVIKSYPLPSLGMSTGQKEAYLRDVSVDIVRIADELKCPIACENLDFSAKKSQLRHSGSKSYNRMLSGFVYDKFRAFLVARAEKFGVEVKFVSPYLTSVIGMVKYMQRYGMNSATAAAYVIARKAMGFVEKIPPGFKFMPSGSPEDDLEGYGAWLSFSKAMSLEKVSRHRLFELSTVQWIVSKIGQPEKVTKAERCRSTKSSRATKKNSSQSPMGLDCG